MWSAGCLEVTKLPSIISYVATCYLHFKSEDRTLEPGMRSLETLMLTQTLQFPVSDSNLPNLYRNSNYKTETPYYKPQKTSRYNLLILETPAALHRHNMSNLRGIERISLTWGAQLK